MRTRSLRGSPPWAQARSVVSSSGRSATSTVSVSPRPVERIGRQAEDPVGVAADADDGAGLVGRDDRFRHDGLDLTGAHAVGEARRSWLAWLIMSPRTSMPALIVSMARTVATAAGIACTAAAEAPFRPPSGRPTCNRQSQRTVRGGPRQLGLEGLDGDEGKSQRHRQADERGAGQNGRRSDESHARGTLEPSGSRQSSAIAAGSRPLRRSAAVICHGSLTVSAGKATRAIAAVARRPSRKRRRRGRGPAGAWGSLPSDCPASRLRSPRTL